MSYNIIADLHTHTLNSYTGFGTFTENLEAAHEQSLKCIAITDYGPKSNSSEKEKIIERQKYIPNFYKDVKILKGIECNVVDLYSGKLDLEKQTLKTFDWVIASYHKISEYDNKIISDAVMDKMLIQLALNPSVMMIGHMERYKQMRDIPKIINSFKKNGKVTEINENCFNNPEEAKLAKQILIECIKIEAPICVTSNAHIPNQVGNFSRAKQLLGDLDFPEHLIINSDEETLKSYLKNFYTLRQNAG